MNQELKQFIITEELANAILNYLASKPYIEVFKFIESLKQMQIFNPSDDGVELSKDRKV